MNNPLKRLIKVQEKESAKIRKSQSKIEKKMAELLKESEPRTLQNPKILSVSVVKDPLPEFEFGKTGFNATKESKE